ncbi:MAG: VCBS repeat-containing protein [Solirubrobacteraceae bacterium]|nr:VCBS repeat-containing protein [Solirubrobacteraceae bacterium]
MRARPVFAVVLGLALTSPATAIAGFSLGPGTPSTGVGDSSNAITSGDLNADGRPDLVIANGSDPGTVATFLGNGAGGFAKPPGSPFAVGARFHADVELADVNGDGKLDAITANNISSTAADDGRVSVSLGNGAGGLAAATVLPSGGDGAATVQVTELTGDGKLDLAVVNRASGAGAQPGKLAVLAGDGSGGFGAPQPIGDLATPLLLIARDVTCDGRTDLITGGNAGGLTVFTQQPGGGFAAGAPVAAGVATLRGIAAGDVNGDGRTDLVVTSRDMVMATTPGRAAVLLGDGAGGFVPAAGSPVPTGGQFARGVELADLTGDGRLDLAVTHAQIPGSVGVLAGDGAGGFGPVAGSPFATAFVEQATAVAVGLFNGDALPDLATAHAENAARLVVQLNTGFPLPPAGVAARVAACGPAAPPVDPGSPATTPGAGTTPPATAVSPLAQAGLRARAAALRRILRYRGRTLPAALTTITAELGGRGRLDVKMTARTGRRGKRETLASGRATAGANGRAKARITLTKVGRRALGRKRTFALTVTLTGRGPDARTATAARVVTLKPAR